MNYLKYSFAGLIISTFNMINSLYIPCVNFDQNCYYQPCCEPYICYEETVCIGMNETKYNFSNNKII